jgi:curved DNA-binding protein
MADDYYTILGVEKTATKDQIKKAYRKLAMKLHPDKTKGNVEMESRFKKINEAYAVLGDEEKRRQYDMVGAESFSQQYSQEDIFNGVDMSTFFRDAGLGRDFFDDDLLSAIFGRGSNGRRPGSSFSFHVGGSPFGGQGFSDAQAQERMYGRGAAEPPANNAEFELAVNLEDTVAGAKRTVSLDVGGVVETLEVSIPKGVREGQKLRLKGRAPADPRTGRRGDLIAKVKIKPHRKFRCEGDDLVLERDVTLTTMVLGGTIDVTALDGARISLKIPPATRNNAALRIKGHGVPGQRGRLGGDLIVRVRAALPDRLTDEQRDLFEKLKASGL